MRPIISRADLLRIAAALGGDALALAARSLGYEVEDDAPPRLADGATTQATAPIDHTEAQPQPDGPIVFWQPRRVEVHDESSRHELAQTTARREVAAELDRPWEGSADEPPETPPLSPWRRTGPQLQQALTTEQASRRVDVSALIRLWYRGEHVARLPRQHRRTWVPTLVIVDRPLRLVPFWDDQAMIIRELRGVLGAQGLLVRVLADGPLFDGREERLWRDPASVGMPVLVLGDLGWYGGDDERDAWLRLGRELRRGGQRIHALVPVPRSRWTEPLARDWRAMTWERPTRGAVALADPGSREARASKVLRLLGAAMRIEPGLIRVARRILPRGEADAGTEADVWASPELGEMFPEARAIIPEQVEVLRQAFTCETSDDERRQAVAAMRGWHWNCERQPEAWHLEVLAIARTQAALAEAPALLASHEVKRAEDFMTWLAGDVRNASTAGDRAAALRGWCHFVKDHARRLWAQNTPAGEALQIIGRRIGGIEIPDADPRLRAIAGVAGDGAPSSFLIRQSGGDLEILPDSSISTPASVVAEILVADPVLFISGAEIGERELSLGQPVRLKARPVTAIELRSDRMRMWVEPLTLPAWASAIGRDPAGLWVEMTINGVVSRMRWIPPGRFLMGSPANEEGRFEDEGPQHEVVVSRGYWLGETPVTQALWQAVIDDNPSRFKDPTRPVENVSWEDAQHFMTVLNDLIEPTDGDEVASEHFRLPSEAEWEYACRAGSTGVIDAGGREAALDAVAWWSGNSKNQTHPVGQKQPNAWGLHDMLGNVREWCMDGWRRYGADSAVLVDPMTAVRGGVHRVYRGGSWSRSARYVRAADRVARLPGTHRHDLGFRLARCQAPATDVTLSQFALVLGHSVQWREFTDMLRDHPRHVLTVIHGDDRQDLKLFIARILHWANDPVRGLPARSHEIVRIQCYHGSSCPRTKDGWMARIAQGLLEKQIYHGELPTMLRTLAERSPALLVFIGANNRGLRDGPGGMTLIEGSSFAAALAALVQALPTDAAHPLRILVPVEHTADASADDPLLQATRDAVMQHPAVLYLPLQELDFPTWKEVLPSLRDEHARRGHPQTDAELERTYRPTYNDHEARKKTHAYSFAALGRALGELLDRHIPRTSQ